MLKIALLVASSGSAILAGVLPIGVAYIFLLVFPDVPWGGIESFRDAAARGAFIGGGVMSGYVTAQSAPRMPLLHSAILAALMAGALLLGSGSDLAAGLRYLPLLTVLGGMYSLWQDRPARGPGFRPIDAFRRKVENLSNELEQSGFRSSAADLRLAMESLPEDDSAPCVEALARIEMESRHFTESHRREFRLLRRAFLEIINGC